MNKTIYLDEDIVDFDLRLSNPLYIPPDGSPLRFQKNVELLKNGKLFLICRKDGSNLEDMTFLNIESDPFADEIERGKMSKMLTIISVPNKIINNTHFRQSLISLSPDNLLVWDINLPNEVNVIAILEPALRESDLIKYLDIILPSSLQELIYKKNISKYTGGGYEDKFIELIHSVEDSEFWKSESRLSMDFSGFFGKKAFRYAREQLEIDSNYNVITETYEKNNYLPSYYPPSTSITHAELDKYVFQSKNFSELELQHLICVLLTSPNWSHLLFDKFVIEMLPKINKNALVYVMKYCWINLYLQETYKTGSIKIDDPIIISLDKAVKLPIFPRGNKFPFKSPCLSFPVKHNIFTHKCSPTAIPENKLGVVSLEIFRRRMNLFISGKQKLDIFEGLNWENLGITGSIMSACVPNFNPVFYEGCSNYDGEITDDMFLETIKKRYRDSDVDLACSVDSLEEFIIKSKEVYQCIKENLEKNGHRQSGIKIYTLTNLTIFVDRARIRKHCDRGTLKFSWDELERGSDISRERLYDIYVKKILEIRDNLSNDKLEEFNMIYSYVNDMDVKVLLVNNVNINDEHKRSINYLYMVDDDGENMVRFQTNIKRKITSSQTKDIEMFRVKEDDITSTVSRFHYANVRSFYNGTNVFMTPSAYTAYITLILMDCKYFVGSRDPINITLKQFRRGYFYQMSNIECTQIKSYCIEKDIFGADTNTVLDIFSNPIKLNNVLISTPQTRWPEVPNNLETSNKLKLFKTWKLHQFIDNDE